MLSRAPLAGALLTACVLTVAGCSEGSTPNEARRVSTPGPSGSATSSSSPSEVASAEPLESPSAPPTGSPSASAGHPRGSAVSISIPSIRLRGLRVRAYRGSPDDLPGTKIQNRGVAASPRGPGGGVGPGDIGNFIITGHRTSHGAPFRQLPSVREGEHILVRSAGLVYDYIVTDTMKISFRSKRGLARQSAPVPGRPGVEPTQPMITLSTCATPEDHAAGNFWADELGNPEHRINKIGVLREVRTA